MPSPGASNGKKCPPPSAPLNGRVTVSPDGTATYSCLNGYHVVGSFKRTCNTQGSWTGKDPTCDDTDECKVSSPCQDNSFCINTQGSYKCQCNAGYRASGTACVAAACAKPTLKDGTATVQNGIVTYKCNVGYELNGSKSRICQSGRWSSTSPTCDDMNECASTNHGCQNQCINTPGSYHCQCNNGWKLASDGKSCFNCPGGCLNGGNCVGSNTCRCAVGFTGTNCNTVTCPHIPSPLNGMFTCSLVEKKRQCDAKCKDGFTFAIPPHNSYVCQQQNVFIRDNPIVPDCTAIIPADVMTNLTAKFTLPSTTGCPTVIQEQREIETQALAEAKTLAGCSTSSASCGKVKLTVKQVLCSSNTGNNASSSHNIAGITVVYQIIADYDGQLFTSKQCTQSCQQKKQELTNDVTSFATQLESVFNSNPNTTIQVSNMASDYINQSTNHLQPYIACSQPSHLRNGTHCMCCPPGAFYINGQCNWCPRGEYQPEKCQTSCKSCPSGQSTQKEGARSLSECSLFSADVIGLSDDK